MEVVKKRMAAGALIRNQAGEIFIVKPHYRDHWLIPGGMVEENESPRAACQREVLEEIALALNPEGLLCIDYVSERPGYSESLQFVFDGGILTPEQIKEIRLQKEELDAFEFVNVETALKKLNPFLARRLKQAFLALETGQTFYLKDQKLC